VEENVMASRIAARAALIALTAVTVAGSWTGSAAAQTQQAHDIPQSFKVAHEETLAELTAIGKRRTHTGQIARVAISAVKEHFRREEEYILPPLTLAPAIALGHVTPDMRWAIAMADRIKADRETIFVEHTVVTNWMIELAAAAERAHEADVIAFARGAVADALNDTEVNEPMAIVIGEYLRAKLPPGP
jgi:hypothetical protein